jgi:general secretion pathway protein N
LSAVAALLLGLALWPWVAPVGAPVRPADNPPVAPPTIAPLPPLTVFAALFERPLFSPSRRPAAARAPVAAVGVERYRLLGIIGTAQTRRALLADGNRRVEIAEGETVDGATVVRIEQDRVVLSSPGGEAVLRLRRGSAAEPPPGPVETPPR